MAVVWRWIDHTLTTYVRLNVVFLVTFLILAIGALFFLVFLKKLKGSQLVLFVIVISAWVFFIATHY